MGLGGAVGMEQGEGRVWKGPEEGRLVRKREEMRASGEQRWRGMEVLWWAWGHSLWPDRGAVAYVQTLMQTMERGWECAGPEGVGGAVLGRRLG